MSSETRRQFFRGAATMAIVVAGAPVRAVPDPEWSAFLAWHSAPQDRDGDGEPISCRAAVAILSRPPADRATVDKQLAVAAAFMERRIFNAWWAASVALANHAALGRA